MHLASEVLQIGEGPIDKALCMEYQNEHTFTKPLCQLIFL
jgi:hypothetical protein